MSVPSVQTTDTHFIIPGLATAHSHAFQRLLRARTQRRSTAAGSFWSWRGLMYALAEQLTPNQIYAVARLAYTELAMSGVTTVGEFHYLHHQPHGRPYDNRIETAEACIRAALNVGVRICLIRTAYLRGGYQTELAPAQQRFADPDVDTVLRDVDVLRRAYADHPRVRIGVAAHSIRAVPIAAVVDLAAYAAEHDLPFHMHVCEQRRELEECTAEYGTTPVQLLVDHGVLSPRFVGVHATHLSAAEVTALGQAQAQVCICRTTERDLGDGLPPTADLVRAGARPCVGVDSHCAPDAFEEVRAVELDERSRLETRHAALEAPRLLAMGTTAGYAACGFAPDEVADEVWLRRDDVGLVGIADAQAADGVVFAATPRAVDRVSVAGETIVQDGRHGRLAAAVDEYKRVCRRL